MLKDFCIECVGCRLNFIRRYKGVSSTRQQDINILPSFGGYLYCMIVDTPDIVHLDVQFSIRMLIQLFRFKRFLRCPNRGLRFFEGISNYFDRVDSVCKTPDGTTAVRV